MIYHPREDSELLASVVTQHARGEVIDVGTGSGIQAITAGKQEEVVSVVATDINPEAILYAKQQGVDAHKADLFHNNAQYDTIISNTPYLPSEPLAPDVALDGGKKGYEWTKRFLIQAKKHLRPTGQILFLISTRTNQHVIEKTLLTHAYEYEILTREKHFFEELLVYKATHALPAFPQATYVAKGKRSRVYKAGEYAIKCAETRRIQQEALMLKKVNKLGIGPTYKDHTDTYIRMQYVNGVPIETFAQTASAHEFQHILNQLTTQIIRLDEHNISKQELTNPHKHVLITESHEVIQIDWERARYTPNPRNKNQLDEYKKKLQTRFPHLFT